MGSALRRQLGRHSRARPGALRRAPSPDLAHVPVVVRGNVPVAHVTHPPLPGDGQQGERHRLSDEPRVPVSTRHVTGYAEKTAQLLSAIASAQPAQGPVVGLSKSTSNLFRGRMRRSPRIDLGHFNEVITVDPARHIIEAEGMTTFVDLADASLARGAMPAVVPQLKSITLGGAVAGVGIEATSFRQGLVHETIVAMDVLTGDGRTLTCTPDNAHRDLFFGLPNSYGTLGYTLRATARTLPVKAYVAVRHRKFSEAGAYFAAIGELLDDPSVDFLDGVVFDRSTLVLSPARFVDRAPYASDYTFEKIY